MKNQVNLNTPGFILVKGQFTHVALDLLHPEWDCPLCRHADMKRSNAPNSGNTLKDTTPMKSSCFSPLKKIPICDRPICNKPSFACENACYVSATHCHWPIGTKLRHYNFRVARLHVGDSPSNCESLDGAGNKASTRLPPLLHMLIFIVYY